MSTDFNPEDRDTHSIYDAEDLSTIKPGDDVETYGLRKMCTECETLMNTIEGTAAEVLEDKTQDNIDIRKWAKCPNCNKVICIS